MAEVDTITVLDSQDVEREVPTLLSVEAFLAAIQAAVESTAAVEIFGSGATLAVGTATCDTGADQIVAGAAGRKMLHVFAEATNTVPIFLGPSSVTASNGMPLYPGDDVIWPLGDDPLYGITASGSASVRYVTII